MATMRWMLCWVVTVHNLLFLASQSKGHKMDMEYFAYGVVMGNDHLLLTSQSKEHEIDIAYAYWVDVGQGPRFFWHLNPKFMRLMWHNNAHQLDCYGPMTLFYSHLN
jgi:hypothetical protein